MLKTPTLGSYIILTDTGLMADSIMTEAHIRGKSGERGNQRAGKSQFGSLITTHSCGS
jgi:hypothetical protein